jgi:hypothetical protein
LSEPSPSQPLGAELALDQRGGPKPPSTRGEGVLNVIVALAASLFLLFLIVPLVGLVGGGGVTGVRPLASDTELR